MAYASWSVVFGETPSASKWNILGTNDAAFNASGGVTYPGLSTDSSWVWASWSPTLANLSGGTEVAKYIQIGKTVIFRWKYTLAGAGVGTNPSFTLPVAAQSDYAAGAQAPFVGIAYDDNTGNAYPLIPFLTSATVCRLGVHATGGTYSSIANVTATIPVTFAASDILSVCGSYEIA